MQDCTLKPQLNQYRQLYGHLLTDNTCLSASHLLILRYRTVNLIISETAFSALTPIGDHHAATHLASVPR